MIVRRMNAEDVTAVAELEKVCFADPWSESSIASEVTNRLSYWLVAVVDDTVIGYIGSQTVLDMADVMNLAVAPDRRQKGVAQTLLTNLSSHLQQNGVVGLMLEVRASNEAAIRLYHKLGFLQVGRRPGYYRNPKEDALILRKELNK